MEREYQNYRALMYSGGYDPVSYDEWRGIMFQPGVSEVARLHERIAALRAALAALVEGDGAAIVSQYAGNDYYACAYCENQSEERADVQHAPDCPIAVARALLADAAGEG